MSEEYLLSHIQTTESLFETLKLYIEAYNHGIQGQLTIQANKVLVNLLWELTYLRDVKSYINKQNTGLIDFYPEQVVFLDYKSVNKEVLRNLKTQLNNLIIKYAWFPQSKNLVSVQNLIKALEA